MKELNFLWTRELSKIVEQQESTYLTNYPNLLEHKNAQITYKKHDLQTKGVLSKLDYKYSETFFPPQFLQDLEGIVCDFSSKDPRGKEDAQAQLLLLVEDEASWKGLTKKSLHDVETLKQLFPEQSLTFTSQLQRYVTPSGSDLATQRAYMNHFQYKMKCFVEGIIPVLSTKGNLPLLKNLSFLSDTDYSVLVKKYIDPSWIYNDLMRVTVKKAFDNLYNQSLRDSPLRYNKLLKEDSLVVQRTSVFYEYRRVLAMYIMSSVFSYVSENHEDIELNTEDSLNIIRNFLWRKQSAYDTPNNDWWTGAHSKNTMSIMLTLERSDLLSQVVNEQDTNKGKTVTKTMWVLPHKLESILLKYTELPRLTPPSKVDNSEIDSSLKPSVFGENNVSKTDTLKALLSKAQQKRFRVNKTYLKMLKSLTQADSSSPLGRSLLAAVKKLELPFPLRDEMASSYEASENYQDVDGISPLQRHVFDELYTKLAGHAVKNVDKKSLNLMCGSAHFDIDISLVKEEKKRLLKRLELSRKHGNSCLAIAEIFVDLPLYVTNGYCVRLRLYPKQPLLARTSGDYKQLLCDYTSTKITLQGLVELLKCFYLSSSSKYHLTIFDKYLKYVTLSKKKGKQELLNFFHAFPINFLESDVFLYTSILYAEILTVESTNKTAMNVEVDQVASVLCFMSLFFRNKKLAQVSNVLGGAFSCPYSFTMEYYKANYKSKKGLFSARAHELLSTDRSIHKYASMCKGYGQTALGRIDDFIFRFYEIYPEERDLEAEAYLKEFAMNYDAFFDEMFPGISKQIEVMNKVVDVVINETGEMAMYNMQGEKMRWQRYKHSSKMRNGFHPVTKNQIPFRVETQEMDTKGNKINNLREHKIQLLSYVIHSIDAAVMHKFIEKMHEKCNGYVINTLHDCVLLHPNHVPEFYKVVKELYSSNVLYNSASDCFFKAAKQQVSPATVSKICALEREFFVFCDEFEDELINVNERNLYKGEN
jgi:hypothetical protein